MEWERGRRTFGAARSVLYRGALLVAACALTLGGCNPDNQTVSIAQPRGASVAFDSLDGLPPSQFQKLVQNLNDEAQVRHLAVISREQTSVYRVRGYLALKVTKRQTTVAWVWDVFDKEERRTLRISGEETAKVRHREAWAAADDAMLQRIAHSSMEQLSAFLTSPDIAPASPPPPVEALMAMQGPQGASPEAAGIFRISRPQADPISSNKVETDPANEGDPVTPPRSRQSASATLSEHETVTLATSSR